MPRASQEHFEIGGDPHISISTVSSVYVLRRHEWPDIEPYSPGLTTCACALRRARTLEEVAARLRSLGSMRPKLKLYPEYRADYAATFFEDPDGVRLEITNSAGASRSHDHWHDAH